MPSATCCDRAYYCPTAQDDECAIHGGFNVCCAHPELHQPLDWEIVKLVCDYNMKRGWYCTRRRDHAGPCALIPRWWMVRYWHWPWSRAY